ncbi:DEAD-box ATP-dependent RNA helicase 36 [Acorus gramineus]|uniref:DEAD-box ATP-dependent RNA helicase 36 n=1 Tax=Acorus gramineus TaxID=55184 RepID=A0AAV9BX61_ACOGR|nr:DEAD-box ATP-dependent RNA helicase 36 [Acorus gramineus]
MESETLIEDGFRLFSSSSKPSKSTTPTTTSAVTKTLTLLTPPNPTTFADLGLAPWAVSTCAALGMKRPTPVQCSCIPRIIAGEDVLGLAETGSGKTAAFALPILHRLALDPFGVFALVITPTRELAYQLADQFRALGSCLNLRCVVVVGGMDSVGQARALAARPHVVVSTPGRLKVLVEGNSDLPAVFAKTKFLVLDEADRVLDVGFEEELRVIFRCLPEDRQTLLFSATMTDNLQALLEVSANKSYFYQAYEDGGEGHALCHRIRFNLQVPVLLATDVASRGLDIPTVDLVLNYDIPRYPRDYVHRVGRTARAGRGGLSVSLVTQNDVDLVHKIENVIGKQLDTYECKENEVLDEFTKVCKAKRVAKMKMIDDGFDEKVKARKAQKQKSLAEKGLLKKRKWNRSKKGQKRAKTEQDPHQDRS